MTLSDRRLGATALRAVLTALQAAGVSAEGQSASELRRLAGILFADATDRVETSTFSADLRACFAAATAAGATFDGVERVRLIAVEAATDSPAVRRVTETSVRYALVEMCRIVSRRVFTSRDDVEIVLARINAAFEPSEEFAADQRNVAVHRALVALHAATVRDLTQRNRPLPRVTTFDVGQSLPSLSLSNRLYGEADRAAELRQENKVRHPLFMPATGRALSA